MFSPAKPQPLIDFYPQTTMINTNGDTTATTTTTSSDENTTPPPQQPPSPPKKRAETWIKEETLTLITLRHELNPHFNTSKSNKHLWEQISLKMLEKGFDRSPTMCTDEWRNLLKEFKKIKEQSISNNGYSVICNINSSKMQFYKEVEHVVRDRGNCKSKIDSFLQFLDKGVEDSNIVFGPVEGKSIFLTPGTFPLGCSNDRGALNLERELDQEGHPLAITAADTMAASGVSPWNWRETPGNVLVWNSAN